MAKMILGLLELELYMLECGSLKDKRQIVKSIINRIKNRYNVSVGEMGNQDLWQRALLGFACVSQTEHNAKKLFGRIEQEIFNMHLVSRIDGKISIFTSDN